RLYCNSEITAARLQQFNGRDAEVLYAPLVNAEMFYAGDYGDYIFCPSRISAGKRQRLLVEAMAHVRSDVRLILAGLPDTPGELPALTAPTADLGLQDPARIEGRIISESRKSELLAGALALGYLPKK